MTCPPKNDPAKLERISTYYLQKGYVLFTIKDGCIIALTKRTSFWGAGQIPIFIVNNQYSGFVFHLSILRTIMLCWIKVFFIADSSAVMLWIDTRIWLAASLFIPTNTRQPFSGVPVC